jgi:hypothetical protein
MAQRMSADDVYYYANWTLIAALVLGVISTYAIVASGNIRDSALRREVANANARAAEAELALAKFRTPRANLLTPEVKSSIVEKLKPFARTKFDVGHDQIDREVWDFLWNFEPLLTEAGWVHVNWVGGAMFKKKAGQATTGMGSQM